MTKKHSTLAVFTLLFSLLCTTAFAQSFKVTMKSGDVVNYDCSDVESIQFEAPETSGPTFKLEYSNLTSTTVTLKVTPDDPTVRYYYDCITEEQLASSNGDIAKVVEDYIVYLQNNYPTLSVENILEALLAKGEDSDDVSKLPAGTPFVFYAIAVDDEGKCYGEPTTVKFSTLPGGDPADCSFTFDLSDISAEGLYAKVVPSDASVRYWWSLTPVSEYPGDKAMALDVKSNIEEYAQQKGMTVAQVVKGVTFTGESALQESGLEANTEYYIYAYAMDETGASAGKLYKQKFITRVSDYSEADVSLKYRYFNGDDLYALDPDKYANLQGRAYVQTVITPNDAADNWALALAKGDLTDETVYPEESTKNAVLQGGFLNSTEKNFVADWQTCTFLYFGADEAGVDGPLHRLLVTFDKANARPVSELTVSSSAAPAAKTVSRIMPRASKSVVAKRMVKTPAAKMSRSVM